MTRLHAVVTGRVQGVGFREFVRRTAGVLRLTGWVRNTDDGAVEVLAEGDDDALALLHGALEKGPRLAHVEHVTVTRSAPTGEFLDFAVVR